MADAEPARVLPVVVAALAEDDLRAGVVAARVVAEVHVANGLPPVDAPAGERAGLLADVVLGVAAAGAEREELHQLARVVLVGGPLRVLDPVQPEEHGGVLRDREQELLEGAERAPAEERVLVEHELLRADPGVRGREPVVPDERHPLDQLPVRPDHAVEPPEVVVPPRVLRRERVAVVVGRRGADEPRPRRIQEVVDGLPEALLGNSRRLTRLRAEAGTPEQPFGLRLAEWAVVHGHAAGHGISIGRAARPGHPFLCTYAVYTHGRGRRRGRPAGDGARPAAYSRARRRRRSPCASAYRLSQAFSSCPPNSLRMAERSRSAKSSSPRELKRE